MSKQIGRLAMRVEGNFWNAYYAMPDTMDGALLLGSIAMTGVAERPGRKAAFMQMMQGMVADIIEARTGERIDWNEPRQAPMSERSGRA